MKPTTSPDSTQSANTSASSQTPTSHGGAYGALYGAPEAEQTDADPSPPTPATGPQRLSGLAQCSGDRLVGVWRSLPRYWRWFTGEGATGEPSERMFRSIRLRLTLWYCAALAALLIICGTIVYGGTQYALLHSVPSNLSTSAKQIGDAWQQDARQYAAANANVNPNQPFPANPIPDPYSSCPVPNSVAPHVPYIMCWTQNGPATERHAALPQEFQHPSLEQAALNSPNGVATATVVAGEGLGAIRCYALVVHDPTSPTNAVLGVVQVGIPIQGQLTALHTLLIILLVVGALTLLGAALSGLWLANRAMAPARLAFERQQAFIADAAHELRTPLTLMRADAEVLLRGRSRLQPGDAELLDDIVGETAHMGALTTNLLTLARLDAGAQRIERDVVDLSAIATQTLHRAQSLADARQISVTDATAPADRPTLVVGDQTLLQQAALILLDNALKYTLPGGSVTIRVTRIGWQAALEVTDTGVGVAAEDLKRLGERFYRVDKARSREMGGAGLGLAIARGVAAAHQGALTLTSQPGHGTTATLTLPAATLPDRPDAPEAPDAPGEPSGPDHALSAAEDAGSGVSALPGPEGND